MQSQSRIFALFMLVAIPLMFILSDHDIFFISAGIFLLVTSIKNTSLASLRKRKREIYIYDEEEIEELEEETNLNIRKISTGTKVVKSLTIILFVLYCTFYTTYLFFDILASFICIYYINDIVMYIKRYRLKNALQISRLKNIAFLCVNIATVLLILAAVFNKFIKNSI